VVLISQLRAMDPSKIGQAAEDLRTHNNSFAKVLDDMRRDVDGALTTWTGQAAAAASARALTEHLTGTHIVTAVDAVAEAMESAEISLGGARDTALGIANDATALRLTVSDDGHVTAPNILKLGRPGASSTLLLALQIGLNDAAKNFEARLIPALHTFDDLDKAAASVMATASDAVESLIKNPDGGPISADVEAIVEGKAQPPTDPKAFHDWWSKLTPAEKDDLWQHNQYLGNTDGMPADDRDHYNRLKLADELARAQAGDPAVSDKLNDLQTIAAQADQPGRYLLQADTQSGARTHAVIAAGNPDTADDVCTYVPGTGSQPSKMGGDMARVEAMRQQAVQSGAKNPSVIAWYGYDAPEALPNATQQHYADTAAPALDRFQDGLRATHDGPPSHNTVVGHSYGTTAVGDAAGHRRSLNADSVVFLASPGTTLDGAGDANLTGIPHDQLAQHIFATKASHDPIPELYPDSQVGRYIPGMDDFNRDPTDRDFGAQVFQSDPGTLHWYMGGYDPKAHSEYWDQNSKSPRAIGDIIAGRDNAAMSIK
jgi:hypothetical protein